MKIEDPLRAFKALMIWIPIGIIFWVLLYVLLH